MCVSSPRAATREPAEHTVADDKTDLPPRHSGGWTSDTVPLGLTVRCWQGWLCLEARDLKPSQPLEAARSPWLMALLLHLQASTRGLLTQQHSNLLFRLPLPHLRTSVITLGPSG